MYHREEVKWLRQFGKLSPGYVPQVTCRGGDDPQDRSDRELTAGKIVQHAPVLVHPSEPRRLVLVYYTTKDEEALVVRQGQPVDNVAMPTLRRGEDCQHPAVARGSRYKREIRIGLDLAYLESMIIEKGGDLILRSAPHRLALAMYRLVTGDDLDADAQGEQEHEEPSKHR